MIKVRRSQDRGHVNLGWLDSRHTFSFGEYYDPDHVGFHDLRVINEDIISPTGGFPTHPHRDMEIITYIIEGSLEHKDSMGNGSVIRKGEIQRMSAGSGITHSEFNPSATEPLHLLQIWVQTEKKAIAPSYEQERIAENLSPNQLNLIVAKNNPGNAIHVNQDVEIYTATLEADNRIQWSTDSHRNYWIQIVKGEVEVDEQNLVAGDGAAIAGQSQLQIKATEDSELLLFNLR